MKGLLLWGSVVLLFVGSAFGQERATVEVRASGGIAAFLDEGEDQAAAFGGAGRFYVSKRISIEPEFYYMRSPDRPGEGRIRDYEFNVNGAVDFLTGTRAAPYLFGGIGFQLHRNQFRFDNNVVFQIKETRESFGGGIGVRFFVKDHFFIAPEARLGWETLARLVMSLGYRF